jgi:molybdenum cofactor biosynthesis protein B
MSVQQHRQASPTRVSCAVITVSDTRMLETDASGAAIVSMLEGAGHVVGSRGIVPDDADRIGAALDAALAADGVQAVITTGGTGISARDCTFEVVSARLEKRLDGFGEIFRSLSYGQVGAAAILSRACAGLVKRRILIALPGSEAAVRLAMEKLILPEIGHLVREATR